MGDSYREELRRHPAADRARNRTVGYERAQKTRARQAAILEANRKTKAGQMKLW